MRDFNPDIIIESAVLGLENPIRNDPNQPILEASIADLKVKDVRAVYPMIRAINSNKLTRNKTFYPAESLIGRKKPTDPTGYCSFVMPDAKPVIREHRLQGGMFSEPDTPMGRMVYAAFKRKTDGLVPAENGLPGYHEGDGHLRLVPAVTDPEAVTRVLGGAYYTVSIGSRVEKIIESISGLDIATLRRQGKELPPFERGEWYEIDGKRMLSYWRMGEIRAQELSFVNVPSDNHAHVVDPDIGEDGIRLLLGEKKPGAKEFAFFDAVTLEKVMELSEEEHFAFAPSIPLVDSVQPREYYWFDRTQAVSESAEDPAVGESADEKAYVGDVIDCDGREGVVLAVQSHSLVVRLLETDGSSSMQIVLRPLMGNRVVRRKNGTKITTKPQGKKALDEPQDDPEKASKKAMGAKALAPKDADNMKPLRPKGQKPVTNGDRKRESEDPLDSARGEFGPAPLHQLSLAEVAALREGFEKAFQPGAEFGEKSEYAVPLLALKECGEWTLSHYEWAWYALRAAESADPEARRRWGVRAPEGETAERLIAATINEVLNGSR